MRCQVVKPSDHDCGRRRAGDERQSIHATHEGPLAFATHPGPHVGLAGGQHGPGKRQIETAAGPSH